MAIEASSPPSSPLPPVQAPSGTSNAGDGAPTAASRFGGAVSAAQSSPQVAFDSQVNALKGAAGPAGVDAGKFVSGGFTSDDATKLANAINADPAAAAAFKANAAVSARDKSLPGFDLSDPSKLSAALNQYAAGAAPAAEEAPAGGKESGGKESGGKKAGGKEAGGKEAGGKEASGAGGAEGAGGAGEPGGLSEDELIQMLIKMGLSPEEAKKVAGKLKEKMEANGGKLSVEDLKGAMKESGVDSGRINAAVSKLQESGSVGKDGNIDPAKAKEIMGGQSASSTDGDMMKEIEKLFGSTNDNSINLADLGKTA